ERALERPADGDAPSLPHRGAERVLEPEAVSGLLTDLDIREQPEERAAPVGAAPGVRLVETLVAPLRQPLRKTAHQIAPHLLGAQLANPRARDRFDVGGEPLLRPELPSGQR